MEWIASRIQYMRQHIDIVHKVDVTGKLGEKIRIWVRPRHLQAVAFVGWCSLVKSGPRKEEWWPDNRFHQSRHMRSKGWPSWSNPTTRHCMLMVLLKDSCQQWAANWTREQWENMLRFWIPFLFHHMYPMGVWVGNIARATWRSDGVRFGLGNLGSCNVDTWKYFPKAMESYSEETNSDVRNDLPLTPCYQIPWPTLRDLVTSLPKMHLCCFCSKSGIKTILGRWK